MELGFAGLHQLLHRFIDEIHTLPEPQAHVLRARCRPRRGLRARPFPRRVGGPHIAVAGGGARGLLMTIDDRGTGSTRRAPPRSVRREAALRRRLAVLVAVRYPLPPRSRSTGCRRSRWRPPGRLPLETSAASVTPTIAPQVRTRILAEAGGNPLALIELGRGLSPVSPGRRSSSSRSRSVSVSKRSSSTRSVLCRRRPSDSCSSRRRTRPATPRRVARRAPPRHRRECDGARRGREPRASRRSDPLPPPLDPLRDLPERLRYRPAASPRHARVGGRSTRRSRSAAGTTPRLPTAPTRTSPVRSRKRRTPCLGRGSSSAAATLFAPGRATDGRPDSAGHSLPARCWPPT